MLIEKRRDKLMRKLKRIESELHVKYQPIKYRNWYTTVTKGIGTGGVCLISGEYLGIGTIINIQLTLPGSERQLLVAGEVLWSDFLTDRKLYESGIKFIRLTKDEKEFLSKQIEDFISQKTNPPM